jgi:hypothetical protein
MILTRLISKLRLKENIFSVYYSFTIDGGESLTDSGFIIMSPLIRGVDTPKTHPECELGERGSAVFFPCSSV